MAKLRVELTIDGGFAHIPGLAKPMVVDSSQLATEDAGVLQRLCDSLPAHADQKAASRRSPTADARRYRLIIDTEGRRRRVDTADPIGDQAIAELIAFIRERGLRD